MPPLLLCSLPGAGLVRMGPTVREVLPAWWSHPSLGGGLAWGGAGSGA